MSVTTSKTTDALIEAARVLFTSKGYLRTTMTDIACEAKKGRRTLYMHFPSKEMLLRRVIETELNRILDALRVIAAKDIPADRKAFSKTKPIKSEHFQCVRDWWVNREEIQDEEGNYKARKFSFDELEAGNFNLDLCGYPHKVEDILEPMELISSYKEQRAQLNAQIDEILKEITAILENPEA